MDENVMVKNEYNFSNAVVNTDHLLYLVKMMDGFYKQLLKFFTEDEEKNKQFKDEYKNYTYKKSYMQGFEVYIRFDNYNSNINCKDYESFESAVKNGSVRNVRGIDIKLCMDFRRGTGNNLVDYENSFNLKFEPYDITFIRKSNHNDEFMNQVEKQIFAVMNQLPVVNSIFFEK